MNMCFFCSGPVGNNNIPASISLFHLEPAGAFRTLEIKVPRCGKCVVAHLFCLILPPVVGFLAVANTPAGNTIQLHFDPLVGLVLIAVVALVPAIATVLLARLLYRALHIRPRRQAHMYNDVKVLRENGWHLGSSPLDWVSWVPNRLWF
jgi:hypothetical protein